MNEAAEEFTSSRRWWLAEPVSSGAFFGALKPASVSKLKGNCTVEWFGNVCTWLENKYSNL